MSFTRRTFPEVLDNLLTDITGGVAAESHPFPPPGAASPPYVHSLQQPPVAAVISLYGVRDNAPHLFEKGVDYVLLPDNQTLAWKEQQKGARLPDPGTLFTVNYYPASAQRTLTDLQVGSVVRTLAETFAAEAARLYAQLESVYQSAFIDTANGSALDNVVALLGIQRIQGGRPACEVEFTRAPGSRGEINIPAGTRVMTGDGKVQYATTSAVTLAPAQNTVRVVARDLEANDPLPAGALSVLPVPIDGIGGVSNPAPSAVATAAESDTELRTRARNFLHGSERATVGAIVQAIATQGIAAEVEEDAQPGLIQITPHVDRMSPELYQRLFTAVDQARPAGVKFTIAGVQPPKSIDLAVSLKTNGSLLPADLRAVQHTVHDRLAEYFAKLPAKSPGSLNKIVSLVSSISGVEDMRLLSATVEGKDVLDAAAGELKVGDFTTALGTLSIADPNLPAQVSAVVTWAAAESPADGNAIQAALTGAIAYVNTLNAAELPSPASEADQAKRALSWDKLLLVIPLPGKPAGSLQEFDNTGSPALPAGSGVYAVQFVITKQSGESRILEKSGDAYTLTPFERLSLGTVTVKAT